MQYYEVINIVLLICFISFHNLACFVLMKSNFRNKNRLYTSMLNHHTSSTKLNILKRLRTEDMNADHNDYHLIHKENAWFEEFVSNRNWYYCETFWSRIVKNSSIPLPSSITGDDTYGLSNLSIINKAGHKGEFVSKSSKYTTRQTFALRIGYDGNYYYGYQKQTNCPGKTVEGDLYDVLKYNTFGAGRTDRGVSAISQIICFNTNNMEITAQEVYETLKSSIPCQEGRLSVYDCHRVPKKFHSRSSATWRRYLYLFPLKKIINETNENINSNHYDVDINYLNKIFSKIENIDLPYNAFAFKEDRKQGEGLHDRCTIFKAKAMVINLGDVIPNQPWPKQIIPNNNNDVANVMNTPDNIMINPNNIEISDSILSNNLDGNNEDNDDDDIPGYINSNRYPGYRITKYSYEQQDETNLPAICIELVGSRFLRRMVRILAATAIREAVKNEDERNENILVDICLLGDRMKAARPLPGSPLCLSGVGYDADDMAIYKFMPKVKYNELMEEKNKSTNNITTTLNVSKTVNNL